MKAFHNSDSENRIEEFDFSKLGNRTWGHAGQFIYAFTSLIGVWFSSNELKAYKYAHEYEIDDYDFMTIEDNEELVDILRDKLEKYNLDWYNENDMLEKENLPKFREIAEEIRNEYLEETFTGFWVKNDKEFGGESLIVFDLSKIK
jgi:hypothetical protein